MQARLADRYRKGNIRHLRIVEGRIDFASNDTLGVARSRRFRSDIEQEWRCAEGVALPMGATGSRLLTGSSRYIAELEREIAAYHGCEAALVIGSGYLANVALLSALGSEHTTLLYDLDVHASMYDGMRLSRARCIPFRHQDLEHLDWRLQRYAALGRCFVCVESLYSISGDLAPLDSLSALCRQYDACLIIDEAHAAGVYGPGGRGLSYGNEVFARVITFGKAFGCYGAAILGSRTLKEYLVNFARPFIYSTALPLPLLAAIHCAYRMMPHLEAERAHVRHLTQLWRQEAAHSSPAHIQSLRVPGNTAACTLMHRCLDRGFDVRALLSPTVRRGEECLRISLHAHNSEKELLQLLECLKCKCS